MDESIAYPTWDDVGVPPALTELIRRLPLCQLLHYLIVNRVFRFQIKPQYAYRCAGCGHRKTVTKVFEEYPNCEACNCSVLTATPSYIMGKDKCRHALDETIVPSIIQRMTDNFVCYFKRQPPEDFFAYGWMLNNKPVEVPNPVALGADAHHNDDDDDEFQQALRSPGAVAKFCVGESVEDAAQTLAICKAAVLCPFLWDDFFDWQFNSRKDKETPIIPLLQMIARMHNKGNGERNSGVSPGKFWMPKVVKELNQNA